MTLTVAIIGRPNVGKSTLFNRLAGRRLAIVHDLPGVTRDIREAPASLAGVPFRLLDTAGLEDASDDSLPGRMRRQTEAALAGCDVALMLIDARAGVTPLDAQFADLLRKGPTPVILVANKCEGNAGRPGLYESYSMGLGDPVPVSAEHGEGLGDLFDALRPHFEAAGVLDADGRLTEAAESITAEAAGDLDPEWDEEELESLEVDLEEDEIAPVIDPERPIQLAIVGRPNTGKSTLVNSLLGRERMLTGPEAGVTRDAIEVDWSFEGRRFRLVDTAGLRRKARIEDPVEKLSAADTLNAIRLAEVVVLLLDGSQGVGGVLDKQELTIARRVIEEGRALVIAVNKWDIADDRETVLRRLSDRLETSLTQVKGIPTVSVSALTGKGLDKLMRRVLDIHAQWNRRLPTGRLNRWLEGMLSHHPPPMGRLGRRVRLRFITQPKARPPTFALFTSRPEDLPDSYSRFLINGLREDFGLVGVPIRLWLRRRRNPYADGGR
ncbi:ribosome biogenesis GTPase Der [Roseospirillum parvum]|uniref:GTPase Der n=1 Tax=Roseospirillum parvum TaxID=83401 RepID=A0A1G7XY58_9PROT|nr:ribosome biogenesis GTPase Der [Roseospirillum parvum]SDG88650.1 GTP-binding protein [Roseospirillum parvum]